MLNPGTRISQLITELVPEAADLAGGFIWLRSNVPLFLSALFGSVQGDVLANVPAQDVSQVFDPTGGELEIRSILLWPSFPRPMLRALRWRAVQVRLPGR